MTETRDDVLDALWALVRVYTNLGWRYKDLVHYVRLRLELYEKGSPDFAKAITSPDMWWIVPDTSPPRDSPDWAPYLRAVNTLADYIIERRLGTDLVRRKAAQVAAVNRQWLDHEP